MTNTTTNHLTVKLFIGCLLNSEIKMHLSQSALWKQIAIAPAKQDEELSQVHFHGKDYLGIYLAADKITMEHMHTFEERIKQRLQAYCPALHFENIKPYIFAQVFVA